MSLSNDGAVMTMPVQPAYSGGYGNNGMFGGDGAWWIIILFLFVFCGWGNNGWGGNGNGASTQGYDTRADIQRGFDNNAVINKLDSITNGICDSTYALNNAITSDFSAAELSRCNMQSAFMQQMFNMQMANQQCCCDTQREIERGFSGVNYNMATNTCSLQNTINNSTRDILTNQNDNTRAILDYLCKDKIDTLQQENQSLRLAASQSAQNAYIAANQEAQTAELIRRLGPTPVPAYTVPAPYPYAYGCGCNSGCGCGA